MKEKYHVIAYSKCPILDKNFRFTHRWVRVGYWIADTKSFAFRLARVWTNISSHKATIVKLEKGGQKRGKR